MLQQEYNSTLNCHKIELILSSKDRKKLTNLLHCDSTECWAGECTPGGDQDGDGD